MSAQQLIWDIPGGIHPAERKELSNRTPIQPAPLPKRLVLPLNQHIGAAAEPLVELGEEADPAGLVGVRREVIDRVALDLGPDDRTLLCGRVPISADEDFTLELLGRLHQPGPDHGAAPCGILGRLWAKAAAEWPETAGPEA